MMKSNIRDRSERKTLVDVIPMNALLPQFNSHKGTAGGVHWG